MVATIIQKDIKKELPATLHSILRCSAGVCADRSPGAGFSRRWLVS
jgi:hypothetical protein